MHKKQHNKKDNTQKASIRRTIILTKIFHPKNIKRRLFVINLLFVILFIIEVIYSKTIPLFTVLSGGYSDYLNFGIPSLNGFMYAIAICMGTYYVYKKSPCALLYIGFGLLIISRQLIIAIIIESAIMSICNKKLDKFKPRQIVLGLTAFVIVLFGGFAIIGNLRSGRDVMQTTFQPKPQFANLPSSVMWIYSYTEFSFSNFNNLVALTLGGVNHGINTLDSLLPSIISNRISPKKNFDENFLIQPNFTVSTWFADIYIDFGIIGIFCFSVLVSLLGYYLYYLVQNKRNITNTLLYSVFVHNIVLFFFINMFLYLPVISQIIFIPLIFGDAKDE